MVEKMKTEDKVRLLNGRNFWRTYGFDNYGIKEIVFSDGPTGLRFQPGDNDHLGMNESCKATCFPTASSLSCSWNPDIIEEVASCIAKEAIAQGVDIVLAPGVNIKRSPLCGRNFEYFSEDPYLSKEMGAAFVKGLQKNGVGVSLKHFAANNQEEYRMSINTLIDERALREIYLKAFEDIIKETSPWTVMTAYNILDGQHCSENRRLLTDILRNEWKYDGMVISDWYAVNNIVKSIQNGLDLEMPSVGDLSYKILAEALTNGTLNEEVIDRAVRNIIKLSDKCSNDLKASAGKADFGKHHEIARKAAGESFVLLKNNKKSLPLKRNEKILFVGELLNNPVIQGNGSSRVNPVKIDSITEELLEEGISFDFEPGYRINDQNPDGKLVSDAVHAARKADKIVVFAGCYDFSEAESYDRNSLNLPRCQNELISKLSESGKNLIVILQTGSAVEMPWINKSDSVLQMHLSGQGAGKALVDVLFGIINPSGKLSETYPEKLAHTPSFLFRGSSTEVSYNESIFVGYRYYDKKQLNVLFPFGHGLSYTEFKYDNLEINTSGEDILVSLTVRNIGPYIGKEIIQVYIGLNENIVIQPVRKLAAFRKISLTPGEEKEVSFRLTSDDFRYYDAAQKKWVYATGPNKLEIGKSSRSIELSGWVEIRRFNKKYRRIGMNTIVSEIVNIPELAGIFDNEIKEFAQQMNLGDGEPINDKELESSVCYMPLRSIVQLTNGEYSYSRLDSFIKKLNSILREKGLLNQ